MINESQSTWQECYSSGYSSTHGGLHGTWSSTVLRKPSAQYLCPVFISTWCPVSFQLTGATLLCICKSGKLALGNMAKQEIHQRSWTFSHLLALL